MGGTPLTDAHDRQVTHRYVMHYPEHAPRDGDPHYRDFDAYRRSHVKDAKCAIGEHRGDFSECDLTHPLELHHSHVEFSLQNGIDLKWLEADYPGVSDPDSVGAWVESGSNFEFLCRRHHRGAGGVHSAAAADFEAEKYVRGLIT